VRETAIHKLTHETHPLLGNEEGKHSMSQERGEVWNPTARGTPREPGFNEMRPFGEAKSISGHQTLQLMRRPYGGKRVRCHTPCLPKVPRGRARRSRATTRERIPPRQGGQETAISRHITTYRQDRRDLGRQPDWESEDP
jgi:hypothetical protein